MNYQCEKTEIPKVILAVTEATVSHLEIPNRIQGMFSLVYDWLGRTNLTQQGHNFAIYDQFSSGGMRMRVGFPVSAEFADNTEISCLDFGGWIAAHTKHIGSYSKLPNAHKALNDWCEEVGLETAALSWEVYGDWQEDESKLETDVYIHLADEA